MTPAEAFELLGLAPSADVEAIRSAFRARIRAAHPDLNRDATGTSARITALTEAYRLLRLGATSATSNTVASVGDLSRLETDAGDPFMQLVEAADDLGHVSYLDHHDRIIQIVVETPDAPVCQLTAELHDVDGTTHAAFTLVSLEAGSPPPIADIVGSLQSILYARRGQRRGAGRPT